jgi:primary-amine oxidase
MLANEDSLLAKRGKFATKNIWVTPHSEKEMWPAGEYTINSGGGEGLEEWTKANRPCGAGSDPVIWLTMAATHIPRIEDFPVMPAETVGFSLKPFCFFGGNPGVDIPVTNNVTSILAGNNNCCSGEVKSDSSE